jgi:hypothetical protein
MITLNKGQIENPHKRLLDITGGPDGIRDATAQLTNRMTQVYYERNTGMRF